MEPRHVGRLDESADDTGSGLTPRPRSRPEPVAPPDSGSDPSLARPNSRETAALKLAADPRRARYFAVKRGLDLLLAAILIVLLSPLMLLIALAIKLDSAGPVFFVQRRVGSRLRFEKGRPFWVVRTFPVYKFRSMVDHADSSIHARFIESFARGQIAPSSHPSVKFKLMDDPRVTRLGRWLRRTSLDELPQIFNVLKGEMSLVGPRPVPIYEAAQYKPHQWERMAALPGITGLWQIRGRSQVSFDAMIALDLDYVRNQSLWLDLKILTQTLPAVVSGRGAA